MRILVVGSGLMGFAAAFDLARSREVETVTLADACEETLASARARIEKSGQARAHFCDLGGNNDAVAAELALAAEARAKGVTMIPPEPFLAELARRDIRPVETLDGEPVAVEACGS